MALADGTVGGERRTVVLVDDDTLILEAMTEVLTSAGYEVRTARDGLKGLALIRALRPDYIILDLILPRLDGGRLCATLRQDPSLQQTPIIIFSSLGLEEHHHFPQLSADAYVAKGHLPAAAHNLLAALKKLAESQSTEAKRQVLGYEQFQSRRIVSELLHDRQHLEAVLRAIAPRALEVDRDGCIAWANADACRILGMPEADLVGESFAALVPPADQPALRQLLSNMVESEEPTQIVTVFHIDGKLVSARLVPTIEDMVCSGVLILLESEVDE